MTTGSDTGDAGYPGTVGSVSCHLVRTNRPWQTGIDSIVLSVGEEGALGNLGVAGSREFPDAEWSTIHDRDLTPARPGVLDLHSTKWLRVAVLATVNEEGASGTPTLLAVATASQAAVDAGCATLGMPLLATGALGFSPDDVAEAAVPAVVTALHDLGPGSSPSVWKRKPSARSERPGGPSAPVIPPTPAWPGGVSSDLVDPNVGIPLERDQLDVAPYVSMLATVLADNSIPLPLSVGVFGEWGSGKSSFMGLLRAEVERLSRSANPTYCDEIVQIGFNAWHYADSNLWASLDREGTRRRTRGFPQVMGTPGREGRSRAGRVAARTDAGHAHRSRGVAPCTAELVGQGRPRRRRGGGCSWISPSSWPPRKTGGG